MARYWLLNNLVVTGQPRRLAGDQIDDTIVDIVLLQRAGAVLWPVGDPNVDAAAALVASSSKNKGSNEASFESLMNAAMHQSLRNATGTERWRRQAVWYFDSTVGRDSWDGSFTRPLKTRAEWQRRVGTMTELRPDGGVLLLKHLDLERPADDPPTIRNFMFPGTTVIEEGATRVYASGTFSAATDKDRSTNAPNTVTAAIDWSDVDGEGTSAVGLMLITEDGAKAAVLEDLGAGVARVGSWMEDAPDPEFAVSGPANTLPTGGTAFELVDYTNSPFPTYILGGNYAFPQVGDPPGGLAVRNMHFKGDGDVQLAFAIGFTDTQLNFRNCIFDAPAIFAPPSSAANQLYNCISRGMIVVRGALASGGGAWVPRSGTPYPGGIFLAGEGSWAYDGDPSFYGIPGDTPADIDCRGRVVGGPIYMAKTFHGIIFRDGGSFTWELFSPFYGESGYVPIWGDDNEAKLIFIGNGANFLMEQIVFDPDPIQLPTWEGVDGPGGSVIEFVTGLEDVDKAHTFDETAGTYNAAIETKWADLDVAAPTGFRVASFNPPFGDSKSAHGLAPQVNAGFRWQFFNVV